MLCTKFSEISKSTKLNLYTYFKRLWSISYFIFPTISTPRNYKIIKQKHVTLKKKNVLHYYHHSKTSCLEMPLGIFSSLNDFEKAT